MSPDIDRLQPFEKRDAWAVVRALDLPIVVHGLNLPLVIHRLKLPFNRTQFFANRFEKISLGVSVDLGASLVKSFEGRVHHKGTGIH